MSAEIEKFMCLLPRRALLRGQDPTGGGTISERIAAIYVQSLSFPSRLFRLSVLALVKIWRNDRTGRIVRIS